MSYQIIFLATLLFAPKVFAQAVESVSFSEKSICGPVDDRNLSDDSRVARVRKADKKAGCTLTMIGRTCAVSAGHCENAFEQAEFHVPKSLDGRSVAPSEENIYLVIKDSIQSDIRRPVRGPVRGTDWAVLRLARNKLTGFYPGDVQGFYQVTKKQPKVSELIRITGHGNAVDPEITYTQQTHLGSITELTRNSLIFHDADTTAGNSGSAIILENTQEIIGVHTHGGCREEGGANSGTLLSTNRQFAKAVDECLAFEASLH